MINIPVSFGEVVDKITILEIKKEKINDIKKHNNVIKELSILQNSIDYSDVKFLYNELKAINLTLWDIEDKIRIKESRKEFDSEFIELARNVYIINDKRADIKRQINLLAKSELVEEKHYVDY